MEYKIALLLKEHHRSWIESWKKNAPSDVTLTFFPYETLAEMEQIFYRIKEEYGGFYVSGIIPYHAIRTLGKAGEEALVTYSPIDMENTYRIMMQKLVTSKNQKLSRIGMDFLKGEDDLEKLIVTDQFANAVHSYEKKWEDCQNIEEIDEEERAISQYLTEGCRLGKFDLVITYFYSALEKLKDYDVECFYVYPSEQAFWQLIGGLAKSISLRAMKGRLAAVIHIDIEENRNHHHREEFDMFQLELTRLLMEFNQKYFNQMILKNNTTDLELYTNYEFLKQITEDFRSCPLQTMLKERAGYAGTIGYGVGESIYHARANAVDAGHYGWKAGRPKSGSYLLDEKGNLTVLSPGGERTAIRVSENYISEVANQARLSAETIFRIMGVLHSLETKEITSQDLMDALQISLRSANKYLANMEKYGYASVVGQRRDGNKGRPINVYRLDLEVEE